jgi:hypothetical protein
VLDDIAKMKINMKSIFDKIDKNEELLKLLERKGKEGEKMVMYKPLKMPMLADPCDRLSFVEFSYDLPREALTLATEDALERGLLTKI